MKLTDPLLILTIACCLLISYQTHLLRNAVADSVVYDIDEVRETYMEDARFMYMQGCLAGADKFAVQRNRGFDPGGPTVYCSTEIDKHADYIYDQARKLGRRIK